MTTDNPGSSLDSTAQPPDHSHIERQPEPARRVELRNTKVDPLRISAVAAVEASPFPNASYSAGWVVDTLRREPDYQAVGERPTQELLNETRRVHRILLDAIKDGELKLTPSGRLDLRDLYAWWKANGTPPLALKSAMRKHEEESQPLAELARDVAASYMSPDLQLAIQASKVFWGNWQPENRGQRETADKIQRWLQGEKLEGYPPNPTPVSQEAAKRIDRLIRPPAVKAGGNLPT